MSASSSPTGIRRKRIHQRLRFQSGSERVFRSDRKVVRQAASLSEWFQSASECVLIFDRKVIRQAASLSNWFQYARERVLIFDPKVVRHGPTSCQLVELV
jgi:hypothetical protein